MLLANQDAYVILFKRSRFERIIYGCILFLCISIIGLIPFLQFPVYVRSRGQFQSTGERITIFSPFTGMISKFSVKDNKQVQLRDLLFLLDDTPIHNKLGVLRTRKNLAEAILVDFDGMLKAVEHEALKLKNLKTAICRAHWSQFTGEAGKQMDVSSQALKTYNRYKTLYERQVLTQAEFEEHRFNYQQSILDYDAIIRKHVLEWEREYNQYRQEMESIDADIDEASRIASKYEVLAPASGSIQNIEGVKVGSWVHENQPILEISPNSKLLAFIMVRSADIGFIRMGQLVNIRIDAFRSDDRGFRIAVVSDISDDAVTLNNEIFYKITCQLNLWRPNAMNKKDVRLKKGMTFSASFHIGKRTLYQLLFLNDDSWKYVEVKL